MPPETPGQSESRTDESRGSGPGYRFLTGTPAGATRPRHRNVSALTMSMALHLAGLFAIGVVISRAPQPSSSAKPALKTTLIWTAGGPGGADPGGGQPSSKPAVRAQLAGQERVIVAAAPSPAPDRHGDRLTPEPPPRIVWPEQQVASGLTDVVGALSDVRPVGLDSRGPGSGSGADGGRGPGSGPGDSGWAGSGRGDNAGDENGVQPGGAVSWPRLLQEVKPGYTPEAMRRQVEGKVELEIVVLADGSVGRVNLIRSLDARFGLDDEAIRAVRRWRFDPGRRLGKAIPTRVGVELSFNLR